jgi:hypothetical protein
MQRPYLTTVLYGAVSVVMYFLLLAKQDLITDTFAKGGMYAVLPIAMAFAFSFFHGHFTGGFWSCLGIEASRKIKEVK